MTTTFGGLGGSAPELAASKMALTVAGSVSVASLSAWFARSMRGLETERLTSAMSRKPRIVPNAPRTANSIACYHCVVMEVLARSLTIAAIWFSPSWVNVTFTVDSSVAGGSA